MLEFEPSETQLKFLMAEERIVFFGGGAGGGKALKRGSKVLTPQGFKNIEDLKVGDYVLNHVGKSCKVLGVYPQEPQRLYEVTFSDKRSIETTGDHIWTVFFDGSWVDITTNDMYNNPNSRISIPLVGKLSYGNVYEDFPVAPYTLGAILGDGNISQKHAALTTMDQEIVDRVRAEGYTINKWKCGNSGKASTYGVHGVIGKLKELGLQGTTSSNKFIPDIYKNAEYNVRAALLSGLMDSDGYVDARGSLRFYSKSERLCKDFLELVWSVGGKGTISEKFTKYKGGRVKSYAVTWNHRDARDFVSLPRKLERVRVKGTTDLLKVKSVVKSGVSDSFCIAVDDESSLYITDNFLLTHNTWSILVDNLQGVHDPAYFSVFFRSTTTEIDKGLWPEAKLMYMPLLQDENGKWIDKAHISEKTKTITFPSGARTAFAYLELDKHADMWYGSELSKIFFDEFQFRTEYQFDVLRSRNRSRANVTKGIRCTLNPDEHHFVYDWVKPYLDEDGYPIKELGGKTRYYLIIDSTLHTDWDKDKLKEQFGKEPQTYCYIPSLLTDNKHLMEMDASYKDNLDSLSEKKRKQLLLGCWHVAEDSGMYFKREWLKKTDKVPFGSVGVRAYDLAASEPTKEQPYPDYTASIQMWKDKEGYYYITGNYIDSFRDPDTNVYGRFRKRSGERDNIMLHQAIADGSDIYVVLPQDAGAAGKEAFESKVKFFTSNGYKVKKDISVRTESKLSKFEPFASAAEHGLVYIVESTFPNKETLEWFYKELEMFDAQRSTSRKKDEAVDICATGFNTLNKTRHHKIVTRNQLRKQTMAADRLSQNNPLR